VLVVVPKGIDINAPQYIIWLPLKENSNRHQTKVEYVAVELDSVQVGETSVLINLLERGVVEEVLVDLYYIFEIMGNFGGLYAWTGKVGPLLFLNVYGC